FTSTSSIISPSLFFHAINPKYFLSITSSVNPLPFAYLLNSLQTLFISAVLFTIFFLCSPFTCALNTLFFIFISPLHFFFFFFFSFLFSLFSSFFFFIFLFIFFFFFIFYLSFLIILYNIIDRNASFYLKYFYFFSITISKLLFSTKNFAVSLSTNRYGFSPSN